MLALYDYESVIAIFEERHFGRAARRLNVTQPALTSRLRRIEVELETRLFERSRSGVEPTAAGLAFVEGAQRVLDAAAEAADAAKGARQGFGQTLRIGMTQIAAYQVVVPSLAAFRQIHPMARIRLIEGTTATLEGKLEQSQIDAAFLHPPLHAPGLSERVLLSCRLARYDAHPGGGARPVVRYPRSEAPVLMGEIDRSNRDGDGMDAQVEADTALGMIVLSHAGYGPVIVPAGFPGPFANTDEKVLEEATEIDLDTSLAWRALDRRPVLQALLKAVDAASFA